MDIFKQLKDAVGGNKLMEPIQRINQMAKTVESLRLLLKDNKVSESVKDLIDGLITLVKTKPNINGINHYFNHLLLKLDPDNQPPVLKELLEVYQKRWKNVDRKTALEAYNLLALKDEPSILIHGQEKSITSLLELMVVNQLKATIYQTLSRPNLIGKEQAEKIALIGYETQLIDDHAIGTIMAEVDYVLIGCELVLHNDFICSAGTHTLLATAQFYKRPVYVLADSRRILNAKYFPQNVLSNIIGEGKKSAKTIWKNPPDGIKINVFEKEQCPNYLVEKFIFEDGVFTPEELKEQIDKVMVKKFF
jgi:translation initiation factor eIF-2B subunit alpha